MIRPRPDHMIRLGYDHSHWTIKEIFYLECHMLIVLLASFKNSIIVEFRSIIKWWLSCIDLMSLKKTQNTTGTLKLDNFNPI